MTLLATTACPGRFAGLGEKGSQKIEQYEQMLFSHVHYPGLALPACPRNRGSFIYVGDLPPRSP